jgi:hypothetical protein
MNTLYALYNQHDFMLDINESKALTHSLNVDGKKENYVRLYRVENIGLHLLSQIDGLLLIEVDYPESIVKENTAFDLIPAFYVSKILVSTSVDMENFKFNVRRFFKDVTVDCIDSSTQKQVNDHGEKIQSYDDAANNLVDQTKKLKLAASLAIGIIEFKRVSDFISTNYGYPVFCVESWLLGHELFSKDHEKNYKKSCVKIDTVFHDLTASRKKYLTQTKYSLPDSWVSIFNLASQEDDVKLSSKNKLGSKNNKSNDDLIFEHAISMFLEKTITPRSAESLVNEILEKALVNSAETPTVSEISSLCSSIVKTGSGLNDFIAQFPEYRKLTALILYASADKHSDFTRSLSRLENFKFKLGAEGIWAYWVYYALQNSYRAVDDYATKDKKIIKLFKKIHARLYLSDSEVGGSHELEIWHTKKGESENGSFFVDVKTSTDTDYKFYLFQEKDRVFRMLRSRLMKPENQEILKQTILDEFDLLALNELKDNSLIKQDLEILISDQVNQTTTKKSISFHNLKLSQINKTNRWDNWDGFKELVLNKETATHSKVRRMLNKSESGWIRVIEQVDKKIGL